MCPLSGAVGERLARWSGLEPEPGGTRYGQWYWPLVEAFECRNLIERYPGPQGRGAAFPLDLAREAARELIPDMDGRRVVLLGSRLPRALYLEESPFEWRDVDVTESGFHMRYAVIPHPSGLNRVYNDPVNVERASATLREALERAPG